jgi:copper chaperone CopZ
MREKIILKVENMSCGHCTSSVERILKNIKGVESVNVNLESGEAEVYVTEKIDKGSLINAINASEIYTAS